MKPKVALSKLSISQILAKWPAVSEYFNTRRVHCVGCPMAAFETLADVASEYGISRRLLQRDVELIIKKKENQINDT